MEEVVDVVNGGSDVGDFVQTVKAVSGGAILIQCPAAAIALHQHLRSHLCGFCGASCEDKVAETVIDICCECGVVSWCQRCTQSNCRVYHAEYECVALGRLKDLLGDNLCAAVLLTSRLLLKPPVAEHESQLDLVHHLHALSEEDFYQLNMVARIIVSATGAEHGAAIMLLGQVAANAHTVADHGVAGVTDLGVALFPGLASKLNHSCRPSAFISTAMDSAESRSTIFGRVATVRALEDLAVGAEVSISYIPTCGLSQQQRHALLQPYGFTCRCTDCGGLNTNEPTFSSLSSELEQELLGLLDECNECLTRGNFKTGLELCRKLHHAICNLGKALGPANHIVLETHRLEAAALSLSGDTRGASEAFAKFFTAASLIGHMYDPLSLSLQLMACADVALDTAQDTSRIMMQRALEMATRCAGPESFPATTAAHKLKTIPLCRHDGNGCDMDS